MLNLSNYPRIHAYISYQSSRSVENRSKKSKDQGRATDNRVSRYVWRMAKHQEASGRCPRMNLSRRASLRLYADPARVEGRSPVPALVLRRRAPPRGSPSRHSLSLLYSMRPLIFAGSLRCNLHVALKYRVPTTWGRAIKLKVAIENEHQPFFNRQGAERNIFTGWIRIFADII